jgi:hypothetical protein
MKILIDFDDVLFNTKEFRKDLKNVFFDNGVSDKVFDKCYYGSAKITKRKLEKYDVLKHIEAIEKEIGINTGYIKKAIRQLLENCEKYVFSDTDGFLSSFNKADMFMLSYTNTRFQSLKISKSGIKKFFEKIILTEGLKSEGIKKLNKYLAFNRERVFFLDDRVEQIEDVKKNYPLIKTIFVKRKEGRYNDKKNKFCDFEAKNLKEACKIIKQVCQ